MLVKVTGRGHRFRSELLDIPACRHVVTREIKDDHDNDIGIEVELCYAERENIVIQLPRDGRHVWLENGRGDTIDSYHWPLRNGGARREKQWRSTDSRLARSTSLPRVASGGS